MSRRTRLFVVLISTPLVLLVTVGGMLGAAQSTRSQDMGALRVFPDVLSLIARSYVEPADIEKVMDGAMRGLADGLDASTSYLTPDEVRTFDPNAALPAGNVGLVVTRQFYLRIVGVRDGSPAHRAGLQSGDYIRAIDETPTRDMSVYAGTRRLAGAPGSKVTLLIIRGNAADPHPVELVREAAKADQASGRRLPGGEAYVRVTSFGPATAAAIKTAVSATGAAASRGIIIDLRDVADGVPEDGIAAARLFVKNGTIATRADRGTPPAAIVANATDGALVMPVVLLVSNGTGHAAEVFAAALAGNKRATLVGEVTAGLAGAQRLVRLEEGHGLLLTTTRYLQADGTSIHSKGLRPDVPVEIPIIPFDQAPPTTDAPLMRAVEELRKPTPAAASRPAA